MSESSVFFSVIIPTYNRAHFIPRAIDGLLTQSFADWEALIIDDGSTDNTEAVSGTYTDARVRYIKQANAERSAARNNGIAHAQGRYLLFLDSDDALDGRALEELYKAIASRDFPEAVFGCQNLYLTNGTETSRQLAVDTGTSAEKILRGFGTVPVSQCAHRSCFTRNRFDPRFTLWEDTHLWLRILQQFPAYGVPQAQIRVTVHEESTVAQGMNQVKPADVYRYRDAVSDLLNYPRLFPKDEFAPLIRAYIFAKYQMYIYQARINRQYRLCSTLLKESAGYGGGILYRFKTGFKIGLGRFLGIHLS